MTDKNSEVSRQLEESFELAMQQYLTTGTFNLEVPKMKDLKDFIGGLANKGEFSIIKGRELDVLFIGIYFVLNGPVGLGKTTQYNNVEGECTVRSRFSTLNKTGWLKFVQSIKNYFEEKEITIQCKMLLECGAYYPNENYPNSRN